MNCPHCNKVIVVKITKDTNAGQSTPAATDDLGELLEAVNPDSLDEKSLEFYTQTKERYAQYGDRTRMSDKQMKWLRELAAPETKDAW